MATLPSLSPRELLASFLRERRARLQPQDVGLPPGVRRRTRGLRREEVAQIAGIGLTWYTWLEQARDIRVSSAFLDNLAKALRLDQAEREYLFTLAQEKTGPPKPQATPALQRMLDGMAQPAYLVDTHWDVVAWNAATIHLLTDFGAMLPEQRNTMLYVFLDPHCRQTLLNWEHHARVAIAMFRFDIAGAGDDARFAALTDELLRGSREFAQWWPQQDVKTREHGTKRYHQEDGSIACYEHTAFAVEGTPGLRMVMYTRVEEG
ncbi:MAG TPA: helix-turn-helix transcriptional regulator [Dyella sp.]|uniref:helix-turn-helix transcriptional regulator n=1 Tax=Dyella sp. TaxID=1869338 RepID=UPI002CFF230B|nr:helix-turn-helix transcriptional regulator [Dyella sp.]HUB91443.1 helix-turn-helix transcriptional regulator [Dyella sp.]